MIKLKKFKSVGIIGFAGYLPFQRKKTQGIEQKAVASPDEDCLTMAVEASRVALKRARISPKKIGAVFVGSESHPYAVKPTGTILADILGIGPDYFCADLQFACKAGTTGLQIVAGLIEAGMIDYGLVVGSDKAQAAPGDVLELTAGAGAAAFVLAKKPDIELKATWSVNSDTPDFWRRAQQPFPSHLGRFTAGPGYLFHLKTNLKTFFKKINKKATDFNWAVFHMPNVKLPLKIAQEFGFTDKQIKPGFLVSQIGNPYAASSLLGLVAVLEQAKENQDILLASYGSGAGSDAFWFKTRKKRLR